MVLKKKGKKKKSYPLRQATSLSPHQTYAINSHTPHLTSILYTTTRLAVLPVEHNGRKNWIVLLIEIIDI